MEQYLEERSKPFNVWSEFSCPDSCGRYGCRDPDLHIPISLVGLIAISSVSGRKALDIFQNDYQIGFDPIDEEEPWVGRLSIELKKPCHFLHGKGCEVYPRRPIVCALFPEYSFMLDSSYSLMKKEIFKNFSCVQRPYSISPRRREVLQQLFEMSIKDTFLSDFYLFGISPFLIDLKNIAGEGIPVSEEKVVQISYHQIGTLVSKRLSEGGYLNLWKAEIEQLDRERGLEGLGEMKQWTDRMAGMVSKNPLRIAHQFDGKKLQPIRLQK